ncbi:PQQ-binding-like beta-propeller repeat protein [Novosphingobium sp. ZN18A2]|uniref:outer membrane protein assembly factor BamB family protein n=1 Tax=Novosphingobium sp. ZN18A2 TaxID=3079861 RepID=UPI0030D2ECB9
MATACSPSFSDRTLSQPPGDNWITNGGSLNNQRYSPLDEINSANVGKLKGVWLTHLGGSGVSSKYSAEGQPLEYDGVLYVPTGEDDVFAVSVETGKILWKYDSGIDQQISTICCGWLSRGVALGPGKVFIGQLDGKLVALDQKTGKVVWSVQPVKWQDGYSLTAAPLYVDGKVIIGTAGGEYGIRGRVMAFDAKTGKEVWRFYTVPGPGEAGYETWPQDSDAWKRGGGSVWQTPSVDTDLGLLYFSTGNAGPDYDGSTRAGDNLYTSSIVALDLKTGKLRWHYQLVHHDIWDYDAPSPTVLFDTTIDGKPVKGIAEAAKTGWVYLLDRTNGKPIRPITETAVPQDARQKTAPTQPIPSWPSLASHVPTPEQVARVEKVAKVKSAAVAKDIFTPFWKDMVVVAPGAAGGINWPPSSYDPASNLLFVCGQNSVAGLTSETEDQPKKGPDGANGLATGSTGATGNGFHSAGWFAAFDIGTGKVAWKKDFPSSCYSGSAVTAGNVVFVGRNTGELQAYETTTGKLLWKFQTGAGANNVPTIFRHKGKEYVAFYAGGNALAGTAHGDNLWLFSLDGKLDEVAPGNGGHAIAHAGEKTAAPVPTMQGNAAAGKQVFADDCSACHGMTGLGGNGGPNLASIASAKDRATVLRQVTNGGQSMPGFKGVISDQGIADVSAYVVEDITHGK